MTSSVMPNASGNDCGSPSLRNGSTNIRGAPCGFVAPGKAELRAVSSFAPRNGLPTTIASPPISTSPSTAAELPGRPGIHSLRNRPGRFTNENDGT
jgi:hypothetical protein